MQLIADLSELLSLPNLMLGGMIVVIAWLMIRVQRRLGPRQRTVVRRPKRGEEKSKSPPTHLEAPDKLLHWEVEMHELARDISARIDSKISALQALILSADERIARLESLQGTSPPPSPAPSPSADSARGRNDATGEIRTQADALTAVQARPSKPDHARPTDPAPRREHEQIYALADAGVAVRTIAEQIGTPIGEVELILSLRRSQ